MRKIRNSALTCLVTVSGLAMASSNALAQTTSPEQATNTAKEQSTATDSGQIGDIVVTARRQSESMMKVPVAVTAINTATIQRAGVTDLTAIAQLAPQVSVSPAPSGSGAIFTIRGIGTNYSDGGLEQSVALNIDGVQVSRGNLVNIGFFDLQQIEVLKGPQALFFGKNSPAGVISLTSAAPTDQLSGYLRAGYEFDAHERYIEGAISGPITDNLKARLAVRATKMRGWLTNTAGPVAFNPFLPPAFAPFATSPGAKHNGSHEILGRATVTYSPSANFDATLKVSFSHSRDNGSTAERYCQGAKPSWPTLAFIYPGVTVADTVDPYGDCKIDGNYQRANWDPTLASTIPYGNGGKPYSDTKAGLGSLTMNYKPNDQLTITSVTGFMKYDFKNAQDYSFSSFSGIFSSLREQVQQVSQELRMVSDYDGPLNFSIGAYGEHSSRKYMNAAQFLLLGPSGPDGSWNNFEPHFKHKADALSAFGQLKWNLNPQLQLAAGVRYTYEHKTADETNVFLNPTFEALQNLLPVGEHLRGKFKDSNWSPELTLSWTPRDGTLVYGSYKTGYKSGGFSDPTLLSSLNVVGAADASLGQSSISFGSENTKGFEIGAKTYLLDRKIRLEATIYTYLFSDLQYAAIDQTRGVSVYFVRNAASARTKGAEVSATWRVTPELTLNGSAAYNRARYVKFPGALCYNGQTASQGCVGGVQDMSGKQLPRAPEFTGAGGFDYEVPLSGDIKLGFNGDANYSSSYNTNQAQDPLALQKSFWLFNAGIRVYNDNWELALIGRNLGNRRYLIVSEPSPFTENGSFWGVSPRPREIKLQASYRF